MLERETAHRHQGWKFQTRQEFHHWARRDQSKEHQFQLFEDSQELQNLGWPTRERTRSQPVEQILTAQSRCQPVRQIDVRQFRYSNR